MPLNLDAYLGVHQDALKVYAQRTSVLANNIANADTPNYKAQDLDFRSVLAQAGRDRKHQGSASRRCKSVDRSRRPRLAHRR